MHYAFSRIRLRSFFGWMIIGLFLTMIPLGLSNISENTMEVISQITVFFVFPLFWLYVKTNKNNVVFNSFFDKPGRLPWGLIVLATIMGMIFSVGISHIQFYILAHTLPNFLVTMLEDGTVINTSNIYMTIFTFVSACVLAPIMEEVIFRGFFLQRMAYKWGIKKAVIISSIIFGLGHFDVIGAFMFGVVMCLLYIKTQNIWTNIAVHALNNLIATSMQFVGGEESSAISIPELQAQSNLWIGIGLTVVGLLWLIPYVWKQWRTVKEVGVPPVRFINEEKVVSASQENEVYSQVIVTDRLMAVELPDEAVNKLGLEENDYVTVSVEDDKIVIKKAHDR
ncbi:CPBP family intramembrane metalloprotease [Bacillus tropicus]|uniref:CPBP family intramembrane glutamic endopeptidase n=1 Tax=Bacillus cereus group TaxID=86661 RepID=UPI0002E5B6AB|nr:MULTISPECIES: CPBP family intramembrane glutamic endopeptidase [Bacillus cereus group]AJH72742.1 CAAX protease self-immunity family protein [Bacillus cereus ATCC 4342]KAA0797157.1 CPBP family intramembrane metalloprotease [Bacillus sp. JAS102]KFM87213.1 CAAX protease self-immunity family protein [Bacillus cereus ATCC 4342]MDR4456623.1 CPBP family intramembrane metalloprotease [Bacillus tropicus]QIE36056.1 CPBP family intramembrane metalloprotease [Bacillus tropicus]